MKDIVKKISAKVIGFLNKMSDQQAARSIEMYRQICESEPDKGGKAGKKTASRVNPAEQFTFTSFRKLRPH